MKSNEDRSIVLCAGGGDGEAKGGEGMRDEVSWALWMYRRSLTYNPEREDREYARSENRRRKQRLRRALKKVGKNKAKKLSSPTYSGRAGVRGIRPIF
jgi:hypothetical protein